MYLLQVWLSGFIGKPLVKIILESEFPYRHKDFSEFAGILPWHLNMILVIQIPRFRWRYYSMVYGGSKPPPYKGAGPTARWQVFRIYSR